MENQTELKWHQKPTGVILLLIFFLPLGLYFMWKNALWTKKTRFIISGIIFFIFIIGYINRGMELSGEWVCLTKFVEGETIHLKFNGSNSGTVSVWGIYRMERTPFCTCEGSFKVSDDGKTLEISGIRNSNCSYLSRLNGKYSYKTEYNANKGENDIMLIGDSYELYRLAFQD